MKKEVKIENVSYRKFSPIDRENSIFEILNDDEIVMDISKEDETGEILIMFHENIINKTISLQKLLEIIEKGKSLIDEDL